MNNKKRAIADREGLESDEEEVEDLWAVEKIEEILCAQHMKGKKEVQGQEHKEELQSRSQLVWNLQPHV
jgi:hypothetical protein